MDTLEDGGVYLILTGSASIGRSGLDGQDPLARRSRRLTLGPLTQRELRGTNANLIDEFWYAFPDQKYTGDLSERELATQMTVGGFPSFACVQPPKTENEIRKQIRSDLDSILGDAILPGERLDQIIAQPYWIDFSYFQAIY